uniref:receptor protein serine/threonine kinase n=1 Tax=Lepeophtheirus salmonis TaxID=72036 RepID=A0A0K2SXD3_LEPSM
MMEKPSGGRRLSTLLLILGTIIHLVSSNPNSETVNCIYNNKTNPYFHREEVPKRDLIQDSQGRLIVSGCNACFTLWNPQDDGSLLILGQGCWSSHEDCHESSCNDYALSDAPTKSKLCCCTADSCNGHIVPIDSSKNHTLVPYQESIIPLRVNDESPLPYPAVYLIFICIALILLSLICILLRVLFLFWKRSFHKSGSYHHHQYYYRSYFPSSFLKNNKNNSNSSHERNNKASTTATLESSKLLPHSPLSDLSKKILDDELEVHFDLGSSIEDGGFGTVAYSGIERSGRRRVLIKVPGSFEAYQNEARIYEALSPHKSILQLLYHTENYICRGVSLDHILVFTNSSTQIPLSSFLKENTISWNSLVSFLSSITDGVAHIHSDSQGYHPSRHQRGSVCHRNLSSDNIYVRSEDLSVCIGDFSRAVRVFGGNVLLGENHEEVPASNMSFNIGDPRYMAPEFLEGTLNFRDAESAFKQADVYSLGLLFWEISRRCEDLYQGSGVPEFEYPFQKETKGRSSISVESMKVLVSRYKSRPLFPSVWKDSNPAIQLLRETIEDSWDQDGEARLTAFCVRERISELLPLWERYKKTKNNDLSPVNNSNNVFNNNSNYCGGPGEQNSSSQVVIKNDTVFHTNDFSKNDSKSSTGATTMSVRLTEVRASKNDNILSNQQPTLRLQPYQGRNPCKERNLNLSAPCSLTFDKVDEVSASLILNSSKDFLKTNEQSEGGGGNEDLPLGDDHHQMVVHRSPNTLIYSPASPIPYLQNILSESDNENINIHRDMHNEVDQRGEDDCPPGVSSSTTHYPIHLISKEDNKERKSHTALHLRWLESAKRKRKKNASHSHSDSQRSSNGGVIILESKDNFGKQCNLDIERTLLNDHNVNYNYTHVDEVLVQEEEHEEEESHYSYPIHDIV